MPKTISLDPVYAGLPRAIQRRIARAERLKREACLQAIESLTEAIHELQRAKNAVYRLEANADAKVSKS